jgi:cobalt-precorrin-5B (C1)-methyltransferase
MRRFDYKGSLHVEISVPGGEEIARRTFNPQLGVLGGISILGTSGIVEPMSDQALIDTIKVKMDVRKADGAEYLVITPGNYGEAFLKRILRCLTSIPSSAATLSATPSIMRSVPGSREC